VAQPEICLGGVQYNIFAFKALLLLYFLKKILKTPFYLVHSSFGLGVQMPLCTSPGYATGCICTHGYEGHNPWHTMYDMNVRKYITVICRVRFEALSISARAVWTNLKKFVPFFCCTLIALYDQFNKIARLVKNCFVL